MICAKQHLQPCYILFKGNEGHKNGVLLIGFMVWGVGFMV